MVKRTGMARVLTVVMVTVLTASLTLVQGCQKTAIQAPIPNQINTFDGAMFRALMDAQAFINSIHSQIDGGTLKLGVDQTKLLNRVIEEYNIAQAAFKVYHASEGKGDMTPVQMAVTQLQADVTTAAVQLGGGK